MGCVSIRALLLIGSMLASSAGMATAVLLEVTPRTRTEEIVFAPSQTEVRPKVQRQPEDRGTATLAICSVLSRSYNGIHLAPHGRGNATPL